MACSGLVCRFREWMWFRGREFAPAGDLPFGTAQKGGEKAAPCCLRPSAPLRGNLHQPASGLRRATLCTAAPFRSNRRGESVNEAGCVLRHSQPPQSQAGAGAAKRGNAGSGGRRELGRNWPLERSAGAGAAIKTTAELSCTRSRMRLSAPFGHGCAGGLGLRAAARKVQPLRDHACGSCLSGARSAARVLPHRKNRLTAQLAPKRSAGDVDGRGRRFAYFLARESRSPAGATSRLRNHVHSRNLKHISNQPLTRSAGAQVATICVVIRAISAAELPESGTAAEARGL